jgi:3-hydroxybutyryl-CoA dehydrogenase
MKALLHAPVLVIGAGVMGAGIAQVAAVAGHEVLLYDARDGAAQAALRTIGAALDALANKRRITPAAATQALARLRPIGSLKAAADARLAIEAIVEQLEAKRALFRELEAILLPDALLATNTSSISITAIAKGLQRPGRLVGMHFFNPVPVMRLVEVVTGLGTDPTVADSVFLLAQHWGKTPVHARSTPGFIANRIARPFYAEALALLQEQAATPLVVDACLRGAGFRMGPCELMDLIGHDTNFAVTRSMYEANFQDKRFQPSLVQQEMVDGGLLGRKSGRGFFGYPEGVPLLPMQAIATEPRAKWVTVHGNDSRADLLHMAVAAALPRTGAHLARERGSDWTGLQIDSARLVLTDGAPAHEVAERTGVPDTAVFDLFGLSATAPEAPLAFGLHARASSTWRTQVPAWLQLLGFRPLEVADTPGLVVARTIAMLINEAADAVLQGVCTEDGADAAMKLGVNYPRGPFEWLRAWSRVEVIQVLHALDRCYRGERYRVSSWLQRPPET